MLSSAGDLSSLTKPPLCVGAWSAWLGGFPMSQRAATRGWEPDKPRSRQQLMGSRFAYYSK